VTGTSKRSDEPPRLRDVGGDDLAGEALELAAAAVSLWCGATSAVTVVAVDGHGASGKTTLAGRLCDLCEASLVHTDDFFIPEAAAGGDGGQAIGSYYDLARLRREALGPLRAGREAVYRPYDWDSGRLSDEYTHVAPAGLVVVEGVCSAGPALRDLVDKTIYVKTPEAERMSRLRGLIAPEDWDDEWLRAERRYFADIAPEESFDIVISGAAPGKHD
jgi:hypothetical protein